MVLLARAQKWLLLLKILLNGIMGKGDCKLHRES